MEAALFLYVYVLVLSGGSFFDWPTTAACSLWSLVEVAWGLWMFLDERRQGKAKSA